MKLGVADLKPDYEPGSFGFDPLGLYPKVTHTDCWWWWCCGVVVMAMMMVFTVVVTTAVAYARPDKSESFVC